MYPKSHSKSNQEQNRIQCSCFLYFQWEYSNSLFPFASEVFTKKEYIFIIVTFLLFPFLYCYVLSEEPSDCLLAIPWHCDSVLGYDDTILNLYYFLRPQQNSPFKGYVMVVGASVLVLSSFEESARKREPIEGTWYPWVNSLMPQGNRK